MCFLLTCNYEMQVDEWPTEPWTVVHRVWAPADYRLVNHKDPSLMDEERLGLTIPMPLVRWEVLCGRV